MVHEAGSLLEEKQIDPIFLAFYFVFMAVPVLSTSVNPETANANWLALETQSPITRLLFQCDMTRK